MKINCLIAWISKIENRMAMKIEWIWIIIWYLNINYYLKINELIEWLSEIEK